MRKTLVDDWRHIDNGNVIPSEPNGYCDQPSIVKADDGTWVCTLTTSPGEEGSDCQYISIIRSSDQGKTWSPHYKLENEGPWESAYSTLVKDENGSIFCFYCYNLEQINIKNGPAYRYDMGGAFCYRHSDDNGVNWSKRHEIPIREFDIDKRNPLYHEGKKLKFFWNVSKPHFYKGVLRVALIKFECANGKFLSHSEGVLLESKDISIDPENATWTTLPDGDIGLRTPPGGGNVSEEQCYVTLSDGTIFCIYRTIDGHPSCSISRDNGHTFLEPFYPCYDDGRLIKQNRAANFIWNIGSGRYLYWYHNNGYKDFTRRNPVWLCAAIEKDTPEGKTLRFSQPEILLYHGSSQVCMSYPDLLIDNGKYYVTETQKTIARIHEIPAWFIEKLFGQFQTNNKSYLLPNPVIVISTSTPENIETPNILSASNTLNTSNTIKSPAFSPFVIRNINVPDTHQQTMYNAYTFDIWINGGEGLLLTNMNKGNCGVNISINSQGAIEVIIADRNEQSRWQSSEGLALGEEHHIGIVIDGGPRVIYFVIDGKLDDGGKQKEFGWGLFSRSISGLKGDSDIFKGDNVRRLRIYDKALMTTEIISSYRKGKDCNEL